MKVENTVTIKAVKVVKVAKVAMTVKGRLDE